ncbi:MAG: glycosyltransferase family 39 protein [Ignavibacteriaceae bacterium]|nr:glycosyltransferase family 39 protein [Ignavibacteriaceae bacterium]
MKSINLFFDKLTLISEKRFLTVTLLIAFLIRLLWILAFNPLPLDDFLFYYTEAKRISDGLGYTLKNGTPTAFFPVGYPAFLGLLFYLFSSSLFIAKLANVLLSVGCIYFFYKILKCLGYQNIIIRVSIIILLFYPNQIGYTSLTSDTVLFQTLFYLSLLSLIYAFNRFTIKWFIISGIFCGLMILTRPYGIILPLLVSIYFIIKQNNFIKSAKHSLILFLFLIITILPWTIRNYHVFDNFVFISTNGGVDLYIGNNPNSIGTFSWSFLNKEIIHQVENSGKEDVADKIYRRYAVDYIIHNPVKVLSRIPKKIFWMFAEDRDSYAQNINGINYSDSGNTLSYKEKGKGSLFIKKTAAYWIFMGLFQLYYMIIIYGFLMYLIFSVYYKKLKDGDRLFLFIIAYFLLLAIVFFGDPRFHYPIIPILVLFFVQYIFRIRNKNYKVITG